eukprot:jgi/Mesvir1/20193/Mv13431-RA.1
MAHLVEQEGNLRWVNYVIENAMYTDKVTMVYNNVSAATDLGASVTAGTSQVVNGSNVITTAGVDPKLAIKFKIPLSAGGYNNDQVFEIQDAVIPREYKFTPTSYATTANDRATTAPATGSVSGTVPLTDYKIVASTSFHTNALRLAEVKRILGLMDTGSTLYVTRRETSNLTNIMWAKDQTLDWILNSVDLAKTSAATGGGTNETTYPTAGLTKGQAYVMTWTTSLPDNNPTNNAKEQLIGFTKAHGEGVNFINTFKFMHM